MANRYPHRKSIILDEHSHVVSPDFDGFSFDANEHDPRNVLGIADLIPTRAICRRGRWCITVEFHPGKKPTG